MKRKQSLVVIDKNNNLLIKLKDCGIHPMVAMCDGIQLVCFKSEKDYYVRVEVARDWHAKEYRDTKQEINHTAERALSRMLEKQALGELEINEGGEQ